MYSSRNISFYQQSFTSKDENKILKLTFKMYFLEYFRNYYERIIRKHIVKYEIQA